MNENTYILAWQQYEEGNFDEINHQNTDNNNENGQQQIEPYLPRSYDSINVMINPMEWTSNTLNQGPNIQHSIQQQHEQTIIVPRRIDSPSIATYALLKTPPSQFPPSAVPGQRSASHIIEQPNYPLLPVYPPIITEHINPPRFIRKQIKSPSLSSKSLLTLKLNALNCTEELVTPVQQRPTTSGCMQKPINTPSPPAYSSHLIYTPSPPAYASPAAPPPSLQLNTEDFVTQSDIPVQKTPTNPCPIPQAIKSSSRPTNITLSRDTSSTIKSMNSFFETNNQSGENANQYHYIEDVECSTSFTKSSNSDKITVTAQPQQQTNICSQLNEATDAPDNSCSGYNYAETNKKIDSPVERVDANNNFKISTIDQQNTENLVQTQQETTDHHCMTFDEINLDRDERNTPQPCGNAGDNATAFKCCCCIII